MIIPDYALFRCGQLLRIKEYERMGGEKLELWSGVMFDVPSPLCWPPPATFTKGRLLAEPEYQALSFPPGWQTELYRGVVLAWTLGEASASDLDLEQHREQAKHWLDRQTWLYEPPDMEDEASG
jgi:hypothetical protein